MEWVVAILRVIIEALLPVLIRRSQPTYTDADPQTGLRDRLRGRIRQTWGTS